MRAAGRGGWRRWWLGRPGSWLFWAATLIAVTVALVSVRGDLDQAHVTLIYMLVVLGGSASGGRALGFTLACACFLLIDYFLQTPYDTLSVDKPLDWLVLLAFLVTATVATQLLGRANAEAAGARRRADEVDRLAALGAETLSAGRADAALGAIAKVIRETTGAAECQIYVGGKDGGFRLGAHATAEGRDAEQDGEQGAHDGAHGAQDGEQGGAHDGEQGGAHDGEQGGEQDGEQEAEPSTLETVSWVAQRRWAATERLDGTPVRTSSGQGASAALDA
ncbi:MAG TPA: DUF4118 domain-containing protein, partial [Thermoanaerobaculia bacterium]|nr:DUF4118 domain-containing protein [Thermoanaerobaculia bacterium]